MSIHLSPARLIAVVTTLMMLYSAARVGVLFFEAMSVVRTERAEDYELLVLCQRGDARGSSKMREACLKARADLASPIFFKAVVYAVSTAFKDFSDAVGSPFKLFVCVLFVVSSIMLPILPWCRTLLGQSTHHDHVPMNGIHYISYTEPPRAHRLRRSFRTRMGGALKRLKLRTGPSIEEIDMHDQDAELAATGDEDYAARSFDGFTSNKPINGWMNMDLLGSCPDSPGRAAHAKEE